MKITALVLALIAAGTVFCAESQSTSPGVKLPVLDAEIATLVEEFCRPFISSKRDYVYSALGWLEEAKQASFKLPVEGKDVSEIIRQSGISYAVLLGQM